MKLRTIFLMVTSLFLLALPSLAQDDTTVTIVPLDGNFVVCPPDALAEATIEEAELGIQFLDVEDVLVVPNAEIVGEDGARVMVITETRLSCTSSPAAAAMLMEVSPSVPINGVAPRPTNPTGLAPSQSGYGIVNTDNANLRSCPSPFCSNVAVVDGGTELIALGRNADDSWWYVQVGDIRGWIWNDLVVLRGDLRDLPFVTTEGERTPPSVYVGFANNPLYGLPFYDGGVICEVQSGIFHPLVGRTANDTWLKIEATCDDGSTATGWLLGSSGLIRNTGRVYVPIVSE